jgi:type IV fimbrial biogenesis protein FimT
MGIAAILLAIAIPSFKYITNSNRMSGEVNALLGDMQFARAEAIKEGSNVVVCSSSNGTSCSGAATWQTGWIVFSDLNRDGLWEAGEPVLRVHSAFNGSDTFTPTDGTTSGVQFTREGFAVGLPNGALFELHDSTANSVWTRCLQVTLVGSLSTMNYGAPCT